jgi:hypothetical protein
MLTLIRSFYSTAGSPTGTVVDNNLNWQRSARTHAWQVESTTDCDLIVDASGDEAMALFSGEIADANGRSFVSVEVFEGGSGGLIATCRPARGPPFATARATFLAWCDEQGAKPTEAGPRRYETLEQDGHGFAGVWHRARPEFFRVISGRSGRI